MSETTDKFVGIARDLLHLEITLVRRPFVDRVKAPDPKGQLVELAESYRAEIQNNRQLTQQAGAQASGLESLTVSAPEEVAAVEPDDLYSSFSGLVDDCETDMKTLHTLKQSPAVSSALESSTAGLESLSQSPAGSKANGQAADVLAYQEQKLKRIYENSRHIRDMLAEMQDEPTGMESLSTAAGQPAAQLAPDRVMEIRKLWELRPEDEILMRTVISMDGDVIAQINPDYAGEEFAYLHKLHGESVQISVSFWKDLVGILSDFLNNLVDRFFPARGT